jgi:carboxypeptidase family protein
MLTWRHHARRSSHACTVGLLSFLSLFPLAALATAGQGAAAPAGIIGQVTDGTGAVLPGVTVAATSPALQVPSITAVTDARGEYRLTPLPIGTYTVTYELVGFQNVRRENVRLTVGFVARVDQVLNLGGVAETITVSGASPLVDVTNTAARTEVTQETLALLPTSRDGLKAFMGQVPGLRTNFEIGMSSLSDGVQFRVYGQSGASWQMLEGVMMAASTIRGIEGSHLEVNSIEGTRVQTVGSNAEMPRRGLLVDAIVKSGGNDFHGTGVAYGSSSRLEGSNVDEALRAQGVKGVPKLHNLWDVSGNLGGRIVRNRLWFFGSGRYEGYNREVLDAFHPDGTPVVLTTTAQYQVAKLSYQMTPGNRFTGLFHRAKSYQLRGATRFVPAESRSINRQPVNIGKVEWQATRGSSLVTSLQYGVFDYNSGDTGVEPGIGKVATTDIATLFVTGDVVSDGSVSDRGRQHTKGVVSWYRSDLLAGNHEFKAGFDHLFSWSNNPWLSRSSGNYQLVFNNGAPFQINTWNYPVTPQNNANYVGLYVQDAWTLARRLTFNLGIRYARDNAYAPAQCRDAGDFAAAECWDKIQMKIHSSVVPRLHAAYDLLGDGKTVIKGGWGRFVQFRDIDPEVTATNRNNRTQTTWNWLDRNGNRNYDPGEVNLDPNGPDFQGISGVTDAVPNPNEKQPKTDEFSLTLERELIANWAVRATGVYSRNFNTYRLLETQRPYEVYNIPITNPDPGPDGRVGTADDPGTFFTYYDYPASLAGRRFAGTMLVNDPNADSNFKTIEVAATRRLSQGWQLMTAYTATKMNIPFTDRLANPAASAPIVAFNPNLEINTAVRSWEWTGKISGAYTLPYAIIASANFEHRSGAPQARQVLFTGGRQIRSIVLNVEPIGSLRLPSTNLVDVRATKRVPLGAGRALDLRVDVFNALNINTVVGRNVQSGSSFLALIGGTSALGAGASSIVTPRILQLGASFTF